MKLFKNFIKLTASAAVMMLLGACGSEDAPEVTLASKGNMVPDNSIMAIKVMPEQIWNKSFGVRGSEAYELWEYGKDQLTYLLNGMGDFGKVAKSVLDDPANLGVNLKEPLVVSYSADVAKLLSRNPQMEMTVVALLDDSGAFVKVFDSLMDLAKKNGEAEITREASGSFTYYKMSKSGEPFFLDLGVTPESAVLRLSINTPDSAKDSKASMSNLFAAGGPDDKEGIKAFHDSKGDAAVWINLDEIVSSLIPAIKEKAPKDARAIITEVASFFKGASAVADINFKDGETVMTANVLGSEKINELVQRYFKKASDKYFTEIPDNYAVVLNAAVKDLPGLVDIISSVPGVKEELRKAGIDKKVLAGGPGVITMAVDMLEEYYESDAKYVICLDADRTLWNFLENKISDKADELYEDFYVKDDKGLQYRDGSLCLMDENAYGDIQYIDYYGSFADSNYAQYIEDGGILFMLRQIPQLAETAYETGVEACAIAPTETMTGLKATIVMSDRYSNMLEQFAEYFAKEIRRAIR